MNRVRRSLLIMLVVLVFDQATKLLVRYYAVNVPVFHFFSLSFYTNTGSAFGILKGANLSLIFISLIVVGLGMVFYERVLGWREWWAFALIGGGVLGNLIDRVAWGSVTDFISFSFWPAFNVADSALSIGVAAVLVYWVLEQFHPASG